MPSKDAMALKDSDFSNRYKFNECGDDPKDNISENIKKFRFAK
jgi:hypothetical protein